VVAKGGRAAGASAVGDVLAARGCVGFVDVHSTSRVTCNSPRRPRTKSSKVDAFVSYDALHYQLAMRIQYRCHRRCLVYIEADILHAHKGCSFRRLGVSALNNLLERGALS
jgi:hypothetical protein